MPVDPLVFIPIDRWREIKSVFECDLPRSLPGLTILDKEEYVVKSGCDYGFKVYCPYGNVNNGIVALNIKKTFYEVVIQCPKDDTKELEEALINTKIIDWEKSDEVPYAPSHVVECVKRVSLIKNSKLQHITTTTTYVLDKDSQLYDFRLPPGFSFENLSLEYVKLVDDNWPHKYPNSDWYFELLIKAKLGYGLFKDKELLSWVFIKEMGALGHLYTLESHRRKGYGEMTLKMISNLLLKDKQYVIGCCTEGNSNAANLYNKLGFKIVSTLDWINFDSK